LLKEEEKSELQRQKKKDKKKRAKTRYLAEKEGVSYEEMEKQLDEERKEKKR